MRASSHRMKSIWMICLFLGMAHGGPVNTSLTDYLPEDKVIYTGEYDIVNIFLPYNEINNNGDRQSPTIFFALADDQDGKIIDKGIFIRKHGEVTKLLDHGRDITAEHGEGPNTAYFANSDGLYSYNLQENKAEKYGTINDNLIGVAKLNGTDGLYILTKDHEVYKITENGTKKQKINEINYADQIVLDYENHLYYTKDKEIYVYGPQGIKKIDGIPKSSTNIRLIRSPIVFTDVVIAAIDTNYYYAYSNGTGQVININFPITPTAFSLESSFMIYFGYNKKIYEINILDSLLGRVKDIVNSFVSQLFGGWFSSISHFKN